MEQTAYITLGLPGSGKTTWAREKMKELIASAHMVERINNDDIRDDLTNDGYSQGTHNWTPKFEKEVGKIRTERIRSALSRGCDIIIDNTNLNPNSLTKLTRFLSQEFPDVCIQFQDFTDVSVETCIERDNARKKRGERFVGEHVIINMWAEFIVPYIPFKPYDPSLPCAIMCDLDGTLALLNGRYAYDASKCDETDTPNPHVLHVVNTYRRSLQVIFVSGRSEKDREPTIRFLQKKCGIYEDVMLLMRADGDMRPDEIVKKELYEASIKGKYNILFVIDDRPKVIRMWKTEGIPVFSVGHGNEF
jgi:predicted kinase